MARCQAWLVRAAVVFLLSISQVSTQDQFGTTAFLPYLESPAPEKPLSVEDRLSARVNHETLLIKDLFDDYNAVARPVINMSDYVEVKFALRLLSIQLAWTDERLRWDPAMYGGIETLIIPNSLLWLPDTFLYESADDHGYILSSDRVPVSSNGAMEWWPSATLRSPCTIDVTYFPFDRQRCKMQLGPWGYHSDQVNYTLFETEANLDRYTVSGAWSLVETVINRNVTYYPDLGMSYTLIDVTIGLKRKALYYWLNVIIPCLLLNCLGIGLFVLPADSGEKVGFGLGILLTVFVFAILVNENIPKTSDYTPIIGIYLVLIMSMISLSLFLAIIIVNLHHRRPKLKSAPKWIKKLLLEKIPSTFKIDLPQLPLFTGFTMQGITPKKKKKMKMMRKLRIARQEEEEARRAEEEQLREQRSSQAEWNGTNGETVQLNILDNEEDDRTEAEKEFDRLQEAYKNMPFDEKHNDEWILMALILDKILFWSFLAILLLSSSLVLIIVPSAQ